MTDTDTTAVRDAVFQALVAEAQPDDGVTVTATTPLVEGGLELTSLGLIRVLIRLEEDLDITLDDEDVMAAELTTVADVLSLVDRSEHSGATAGR